MTANTTAAEIRAALDHPVVDGDGHWIEYFPVTRDAMRRIGGDAAAEGFGRFGRQAGEVLSMTTAQRRHANEPQEAWWAMPTRNTRDRATAMMPALLHERMEEFGLDFTILFPTMGLGVPRIPDDAVRRVTCQAYNTYAAERFAAYGDRMTAAAVIPMYSPDEAIEVLDHAVQELGLKVAMFGSMVPRSIPKLIERGSDAKEEFVWLDVLGMDSLYDYDPVWQRCEELGISPAFHSNGRGQGFGLRASPSNFTYNHIGHFAAAGEAVCKALFMGGVTRRFPNVHFGFLEGGVSWACQLLVDLIEHWEIRNIDAIEAIRPSNLDMDLLQELAGQFGDEAMQAAVARAAERSGRKGATGQDGGKGVVVDDFAACGINKDADIADLYVDRFWFGCESDDRMAAWAFKSAHNPFGARLNAVFGSDIGHFDVTDMAQVLPAAHSLVSDGLIDDDDFRDFTFTNSVRFFGDANSDFFTGTAVETEARAVLSP